MYTCFIKSVYLQAIHIYLESLSHSLAVSLMLLLLLLLLFIFQQQTEFNVLQG